MVVILLFVFGFFIKGSLKTAAEAITIGSIIIPFGFVSFFGFVFIDTAYFKYALIVSVVYFVVKQWIKN
jgi:hypothetical protein